MGPNILSQLANSDVDAEPRNKRSQDSVVPRSRQQSQNSSTAHMEDPNPRSQTPDPTWAVKGGKDSLDVNYRLSPEKLADQDTPTNDDYIPTQPTPISEPISNDADDDNASQSLPTPLAAGSAASNQPNSALPGVNEPAKNAPISQNLRGCLSVSNRYLPHPPDPIDRPLHQGALNGPHLPGGTEPVETTIPTSVATSSDKSATDSKKRRNSLKRPSSRLKKKRK